MRATRKKRAPFMNPKRWTAVSIVLLLAVIAALNIWYQSIFADSWSAEDQAEQRAIEAASLTEVDSAEKYVWDETAWVVNGTTKDGQQVYVWLRDQSVDTVPASDAVTKQQVRQAIEQNKPDARIEHIRPGIVKGQHVWEVFYSRQENGQRKYAYDFFSFENGTFIETLKLPVKRLAE